MKARRKELKVYAFVPVAILTMGYWAYIKPLGWKLIDLFCAAVHLVLGDDVEEPPK